MSFIYFPIFPLGLGISLIGFIFGYWLEKFNFSKMYKKPEKLDNQITEIYMNFFVIIFWAYGIGNFYFLSDAYEKSTWAFVNLFSFCLIIIIPFHSLFRIDFFKFKESKIQKKKYDDKYFDFNTDYERLNPITKIEGEIRYLDKKKNKLNKEEIDKKIEPNKSQNLNNINLNDEHKDEKNKNNIIKPITLLDKNLKKKLKIHKRKSQTKVHHTSIININESSKNDLINQGNTIRYMPTNSIINP